MVWDRFVRFFHWSLAGGVILNYWLLEGGENPHEWLGYGLALLVAARIAWGFTGPPPARFRNFLVTPRRALQSIRHPEHDYREHTGHTPLGGWMMLFMLCLVAILAASGWMQELDAFWGVEWPQLLHAWTADVLIAAAAVHVTAVLWIQWRYKLPLLRAMLGDTPLTRPGRNKPL